MARAPLLGAISLIAASLSACASSSSPPDPVRPLVGPNEQVVETNFTPALECLASHVRSQSYEAPRIAVGHITDLTGATDYFAGRRITQGAALMAMTALADSGMRVIERFDMGVIEVELNYAQNGLVRDSAEKLREVQAGQLEGADLYIVGGITEFNPNIRSSAAELSIDGLGDEDGIGIIGGNSFTIDVGLDLRLVDVRSSEVLSVRSFRKQVIGKERSAGVFEFIGGNIVDVNAGQRAMEPVQTAVRTMVDRAVFEFVAALYNVQPEACLDTASRHAVESNGMRRRGGDSHVLRAVNAPRPSSPSASSVQQAAAALPHTQNTMVQAPTSQANLAGGPHGNTTYGGTSRVLFLSSHSSREAALDAWSHASLQAGPVLGTYRPTISQSALSTGGSEYRLLVELASGGEDAQVLCDRLVRYGVSCRPYLSGGIASYQSTTRSSRSVRTRLR
jgi:curli production assembly/transport component CsgG/holdfast attachment protein HfaB